MEANKEIQLLSREAIARRAYNCDDWGMPPDASPTAWLAEAEALRIEVPRPRSSTGQPQS